MNQVINGKRYDTETAEYLGGWYNTENTCDYTHYAEGLYRTESGSYFIHKEGGPMSPVRVDAGMNQWSSGERIELLSETEAKAWAEEHMTGDEYEAVFGPVEE